MADGTLIFDTKIDDKGIKKDSQSVKAQLSRFSNSIQKLGKSMANGFSGSSSKVTDLNGKIKVTQSEISKLTSEIKQMEKSPPKSDMFSKLEKDASKAEKKMLDLLNQREALENNIKSNVPKGLKMNAGDEETLFKNNSEWKKLTSSINKADNVLTGYETKMNSMSDSEKVQVAKSTKAYQTKQTKLQKLNTKLDTYKKKLDETKAKEDKAGKSIKKYADKSATAGKQISNISKMISMGLRLLATMALFKIVQSISKALTESSQHLAQYSNQYANSIAQIKSANTQFKNSISTAFAPLLQAVTPILTTIINKFTVMATMIAQFNAALFGHATKFVKAKKVVESYGGSVDKAKKKVKSFTSSIDELNVIDTSSNDSGAGGSGPSPGQMFETVEIDSGVQGFVDKIRDLFKPLKEISFDNLSNSLDNLKTSLEPLGQTIWDGLSWGIEYVVKPLAGIIIEDIVPAFIDLLSAAIEVLNSILEAAKPTLEWLWTEFLLPIAEWTGGVIVDVIQDLTDRLKDFSKWIDDHHETVQNFVIIIASFAAAWGLVNIAIGVWNILGVIATGVTTAFGVALSILTSPITLVILAIGAIIAIIVICIKYWDEIKIAATKAVYHIQCGLVKACNFMIRIVNATIKQILKPINKMINGINLLPDMNIPNIRFRIDQIKLPEPPKLATGAVIPPNSEFMAILGDQKSGMNIEAPADLIAKIVRENSSADSARIISVLMDILEVVRAVAENPNAPISERDLARMVASGNKRLGYQVKA